MEREPVLGSRTSMERWLGTVGAQLKRFLRGAVCRHRERSLRLCETLSLGDKRFLAVVQVNQEHFLVGGAGNSIALLTHLPSYSAPRTEALPDFKNESV